MVIEQTIEFELREPELPGRTCTSTTGYFYDKTQNLLGKSLTGLLFTPKILHKAMYPTFPYQGLIT